MLHEFLADYALFFLKPYLYIFSTLDTPEQTFFFPVLKKLKQGTFRFRRKKGLQDRQKRPKTRFQKA